MGEDLAASLLCTLCQYELTNEKTPQINRVSNRIGLAPSVDVGYAKVPYGLYIGGGLCILGLLGVLFSLWFVLQSQIRISEEVDLEGGYQLLRDDSGGGEGGGQTASRATMAALELFQATAGVGNDNADADRESIEAEGETDTDSKSTGGD